MRMKIILKLVATALVLSYPLLVHWALPHWRTVPGLLPMLPPSVLNTWLAWLFGRTLLAGREPMISTFARIERSAVSQSADMSLPSELARYTRTLTVIWSALFAAMALISALLAVFGKHIWWAIFTGAVSYGLMTALFLGEYIVRRVRFAHYPHAQPVQMIWFLIKSKPIWMGRQ